MTRGLKRSDGSLAPLSPLSSLMQQPDRMSMVDVLDPTLHISPQFNPEEFSEELEANWAELAVPGLSHFRLQYVNTSNDRFTFTLHYDATSRTPDEHAQYLDDRKFLQAHCYAHQGAMTIAGGAPPRVLFVWPNFIALTAVIRNLKFRYTRFNVQAMPVKWDVEVLLQEIRDTRLTFEEVMAQGTIRSGSAAIKQGT